MSKRKLETDDSCVRKNTIVYCGDKGCHCEYHVLFYHANCPDGVTALWAALYGSILSRREETLAWEELIRPPASPDTTSTSGDAPDTKRNTPSGPTSALCQGHELFPLGAGQVPVVDAKTFYTNKTVLLVDVSFKAHYLKKVCKHLGDSGRVVIMDHHKSAQRELSGVQFEGRVRVMLDMERAGCQVVWDTLCLGKRPLLLDYVADRDLWAWRMPHSREVNHYMFVHGLLKESNLVGMTQLFLHTTATELQPWIDEARPLMAAGRVLIDRAVTNASTRSFTTPTSRKVYKVKLTSADSSVVSDVGHELVQAGNCDFAVMWYYDPFSNQFGFSCRSDADRTDIDLSQICAEFEDGGGHPQAAGFRIPNVSVPVCYSDGNRRASTMALAPKDKAALRETSPIQRLFPDWEESKRDREVLHALTSGETAVGWRTIPVPPTHVYMVCVPRDPSQDTNPFAAGWQDRLMDQVGKTSEWRKRVMEHLSNSIATLVAKIKSLDDTFMDGVEDSSTAPTDHAEPPSGVL
jgi:uncharacterized protein